MLGAYAIPSGPPKDLGGQSDVAKRLHERAPRGKAR